MNKLLALTGGTKGIGRAIVERFALAGFDIVTCARKENDLADLKLAIKTRYFVNVHTLVADMSVKEQVVAFGGFVTGLQQPVDVLVNNAGFFIPGSLLDEEEGALERMIESNVYSAYHLSRSVVPTMKTIHKGHVFNMCSIASIKAYPNGGSYAISKFALLGFSKVLREELKEYGVRVTAVLPGATRTASWDGVDLPEDRFMRAEDVAETVFSAYSISKRSVVEEIIIRPQLGDI
jgi:short-subunit dehydrogenase